MATEVHNASQTVEPSILGPGSFRGSRAGPPLSQRRKAALASRALLGVTRWAVVLGFIACGYFGAAIVNLGVRHASPDQQRILAASQSQE